MIPKEKMDECVARFTQNPYWRAYLDNAPESAKEYIRMEFAFSLLGDEDRNDEEFKAAKNHYIDIWKARMGVKEGKVKGDGLDAMSERDGKLATRSDEEWFAILHRCGNITCKAACGTCYERVTGKRFPIEAYRKWEASLAKNVSYWKGVWVSDAIYAAAPEWAKRYCEHHRWVEYVGKGEPPDGKDGRKMDYAYIYTKMEDADWDFLIKHTHSYARGMPLVMARRHYQRKDIHGNTISSPLEAD